MLDLKDLVEKTAREGVMYVSFVAAQYNNYASIENLKKELGVTISITPVNDRLFLVYIKGDNMFLYKNNHHLKDLGYKYVGNKWEANITGSNVEETLRKACEHALETIKVLRERRNK